MTVSSGPDVMRSQARRQVCVHYVIVKVMTQGSRSKSLTPVLYLPPKAAHLLGVSKLKVRPSLLTEISDSRVRILGEAL